MPENSGFLLWEPDYDTALQKARDERRELFIYFSKPN